jgi:hypothetical protein
MQAYRICALFAASAALALASTPAAAQSPLGMAEVKALVSGFTIDTEEIAGGRQWRFYYEPGGKAFVQRDDAAVFDGYWSVHADGTLCVSFSYETCGGIAKNADDTYTRIIKGAPTHKWTRITPGKSF